MAMLRIVDGIVFEGNRCTDEFEMRVHDLGHGQREVVVQAVVKWVESCELHPDSINAQVARGERDDPDEADKRRANLLRGARRARTKVRRYVKALACDAMLTLTYRANVTDLAEAKADFRRWCKRMQHHIPGFVYVAAFERQARGAWHVHIAIRELPFLMRASNGERVKSYNVVRAMWRSVTGAKAGNVDVSRRRKGQGSTAKIASYLSKYMLKDWEYAKPGTRRFQSSEVGLAPAVPVTLRGYTLADVVELAYAFGADGRCEVTGTFLWPGGGMFYLASGPPQVDLSIHRGH